MRAKERAELAEARVRELEELLNRSVHIGKPLGASEIRTLRNRIKMDKRDYPAQIRRGDLLLMLEAAEREIALRSTVEWLESALGRIAAHPHCSYDGPQHHCDDVRGYNIGVADGHRCAARDARDALEMRPDAGQLNDGRDGLDRS